MCDICCGVQIATQQNPQEFQERALFDKKLKVQAAASHSFMKRNIRISEKSLPALSEQEIVLNRIQRYWGNGGFSHGIKR